MYDNSIALMSALQEAGVEYRSDTPWEDDNLIDTIRVGWRGVHLPRTAIFAAGEGWLPGSVRGSLGAGR